MPLVPVQLPHAEEPLRLLAVHAHPDDESSKGAATTRMYVDRGVEVLVVSCTGGERGDILNPKFELGDRDISEVRRSEMARAAEILGIQHRWLGFVDSGFPEGDPKPPLPKGCFADLPLDEVSRPLIDLVREFRPHIVTTYDENGGYPHPDHIRTHEVAMQAWELSGDATYVTDHAPWTIAKMYYHHGFSRERITVLHQACLDLGLESPFADWLDDFDETDAVNRVTARIECSDYFPIRDEALRAHETQIDPDGNWFAIPHDVQTRVWPTEDYELALSRIGEIAPESDLFEGLRGA
jgi:mycothiol S-conjugate amidase